MKFAVQHRTTYDYSSPVRDSFNDVRLCPVSDDFQICHEFSLNVSPDTPSRFRRLDFYLNQVHHFEVIERHQQLNIVARSTVETFIDTRDFTQSSPARELRGLERDEKYYDYLSESDRIRILPLAIHKARELVPVIDEVGQAVETVMSYIYQAFHYDPCATVVETSVVEVMELQRGVCQDFAHVMITLCRALGIPARYVSGYFYISKSARERTADDNSVSHAWVECFLPRIGWVGYDPTHNRRVSNIYIKVAVGRDYSDVRPVSGTYLGESHAEMDVAVIIQSLEASSEV